MLNAVKLSAEIYNFGLRLRRRKTYDFRERADILTQTQKFKRQVAEVIIGLSSGPVRDTMLSFRRQLDEIEKVTRKKLNS